MDVETGLDLKTQLTIAKHVRKGKRVFLGCCKGDKTDKGVTWAPKSLIDLLALTGFGVAAFTMFSTGALIIDITGALILFFAPYLAVQKRILSKLGTFRSLHNQLREKVNELMIQNDFLSKNVDRLEGSVSDLNEAEQQLRKLAKTNDVDRLVDVVSETKKVNEKMKKSLQAQIVQQLLTTVLRTDKDLDLHIGPDELRNLMTRLDNLPGFVFHQDRFLKMLGITSEPVPIEKIMAVIRNLKDDSIPENENIFTLHPETMVKKPKQRRW